MTASLTTRPGFTRVLAAVRGAELGLLRAVALDLVATGGSDALSELGPEAIALIRATTGPTAVDLRAHATADGSAVTFLGRAGRGIAVSAHLSSLSGEGRELLYASVRLVGTHGSVLVDLLRPVLDVRTVSGARQVPFGVPGAVVDPDDASGPLSGIADSARSGRTVTITW